MVREGKEQVFNQYWKKDAICIICSTDCKHKPVFFIIYTHLRN